MEADHFHLDAATRAELDRFFDRDGETRLRFRNGLLRDVTYGRAWHIAVACDVYVPAVETLERISEDR